jgi:F0F1-type ATP synthase membrane subunit b/b'
MSLVQGIHTYTPETNHVSRVHSVAAILCVLLMVHIALSAILNVCNERARNINCETRKEKEPHPWPFSP